MKVTRKKIFNDNLHDRSKRDQYYTQEENDML